MSLVIERCGRDFQPYLTDMTSILRQTIVDPYPEIKKVFSAALLYTIHSLPIVSMSLMQESCICASRLAKAIPAVFHQQSESLAKPLLVSMTHQHSKVRTAALKVKKTTFAMLYTLDLSS